MRRIQPNSFSINVILTSGNLSKHLKKWIDFVTEKRLKMRVASYAPALRMSIMVLLLSMGTLMSNGGNYILSLQVGSSRRGLGH